MGSGGYERAREPARGKKKMVALRALSVPSGGLSPRPAASSFYSFHQRRVRDLALERQILDYVTDRDGDSRDVVGETRDAGERVGDREGEKGGAKIEKYYLTLRATAATYYQLRLLLLFKFYSSHILTAAL